jgi:hypothetical protein
MKRTIITLNIVFAALVLAIQLTPKVQSYNSATAIAAPAPVAPAVAPHCPNIHGAIESLRSADQELREGAHDFCGHKEAAMRTVHEAIEQLRAAEGCAKCR